MCIPDVADSRLLLRTLSKDDRKGDSYNTGRQGRLDQNGVSFDGLGSIWEISD